jgi:hypothetical protein
VIKVKVEKGERGGWIVVKYIDGMRADSCDSHHGTRDAARERQRKLVAEYARKHDAPINDARY